MSISAVPSNIIYDTRTVQTLGRNDRAECKQRDHAQWLHFGHELRAGWLGDVEPGDQKPVEAWQSRWSYRFGR